VIEIKRRVFIGLLVGAALLAFTPRGDHRADPT
jgi:hypothetical protein